MRFNTNKKGVFRLKFFTEMMKNEKLLKEITCFSSCFYDGLFFYCLC